jgi:nesprin-1
MKKKNLLEMELIKNTVYTCKLLISSQLRHWQWLLDTALPGEFGQIGEWLNQAEALVNSDDVPAQLNEEAAAILNQKIEDHKAFFMDLNSVQNQFSRNIQSNPLRADIPKEQLEAMARRLKEIGPRSEVRAVRLKFLEHKVRTIAITEHHSRK